MSAGKTIDFQSLDKDIQELVRESIDVRTASYSPYSKFKVGAAIRCEDGTIARGCNFENAASPVGTCAERVAIGRAISDGKRTFKSIAVVADLYQGVLSSPCGMCRQALAEFGDMPVYLASPDMKQIMQTSIRDLLPMGFGFHNSANNAH